MIAAKKIAYAIFSRGRSKGRSDMEVTMKNHGWRTAGTLIAALLLYEIGKLAGALAAQLLLPALLRSLYGILQKTRVLSCFAISLISFI